MFAALQAKRSRAIAHTTTLGMVEQEPPPPLDAATATRHQATIIASDTPTFADVDLPCGEVVTVVDLDVLVDGDGATLVPRTVALLARGPKRLREDVFTDGEEAKAKRGKVYVAPFGISPMAWGGSSSTIRRARSAPRSLRRALLMSQVTLLVRQE